jgi:bacterioferritin (cytochrome b1)
MTTKIDILQRQLNAIKIDHSALNDLIKNHECHHSYFQQKIYRKRRASLKKQIDQLKIQIDLISPQPLNKHS